MMLSLRSQMRMTYGLMLLCFIGLGSVSINRLERVSNESNIINTIWTPRFIVAEEMGLAVREYRISEALRILSVSPEMAAHADEDLKANADLLFSQIGSYRASLQSGEDSTPLDKVQELSRQYIAGNEQMLAFAQTGQRAEAAERFRN